ncbi:MAG: lysophospholipid acyltransferase family protein [gamma proteobacterium symbiont of Bathyaustriella thionipta]|nr:lysophospholipid acyltransferase family protein [gamma proteobacterium symbiont of Bathyaustriella thionipta]
MAGAHRPQLSREAFLPRYWLTWLALIPVWLLALLPMRLRAALGDLMAAWMLRFDSKRKRIALTNLKLCYPQLSNEERQALLLRHSRILTHTFLSYGVLLFRSAEYLRAIFDVQGIENVQAEEAKGNNIIMLTPHTLALEYSAQRITMDYKGVCAIRIHSGKPVLDWVVNRFRNRYRAILFDNQAGMRELIKLIRGGAWLYYLPDEDRGQKNAVFAPFYGVPKASLAMLGKLAKSCRASVIPVTSIYCPDKRRFSVSFGKPVEGLTSGSLVEQITLQNQAMERILDADPAQYMWSAKIFRTRPAGEKKLYKNC